MAQPFNKLSFQTADDAVGSILVLMAVCSQIALVVCVIALVIRKLAL